MIPEGVKTAVSDDIVNTKFMDRHLGIDSLTELINGGLTVKHLRSLALIPRAFQTLAVSLWNLDFPHP
ncbi:MAG: hypothetical protein ACJ8NS_02015 [Chthoniobacterales bacterium]